ncbi:MAG: hypothetical protein K2L99_08770 [Muribaculaceae bacterium]|nr:hypothetical protein [Muribaculaceae bacterium]
MKALLQALISSAILVAGSCVEQRKESLIEKGDCEFDFSQFYRVDSIMDEDIYDAHREVPLGKKVVLSDLDSLFGKALWCDTVRQTSDGWALYEQECQAADFMPAQIGDTLVMMRRVYGREGDWIIWIVLEIQSSASLRVLNFVAYDTRKVEI